MESPMKKRLTRGRKKHEKNFGHKRKSNKQGKPRRSFAAEAAKREYRGPVVQQGDDLSDYSL